MNKESVYKAQKKYREKLEGRGHKRVTLWVPESNVEELKEIAAEMRSEDKEKDV